MNPIPLFFRRAIALTWLLFGCVPMTYLWRFLDAAMRVILESDPKESMPFGSFMAIMACLYGFAFVLYMISQIPVAETKVTR